MFDYFWLLVAFIYENREAIAQSIVCVFIYYVLSNKLERFAEPIEKLLAVIAPILAWFVGFIALGFLLYFVYLYFFEIVEIVLVLVGWLFFALILQMLGFGNEDD